MSSSEGFFYSHPTAVIDPGAQIGAGSKVWHFCHVSSTARIGAKCILGQNVFVDGSVVVGAGCKIQNNVSLFRGVTLEDDVFCGPSCVFTNVVTPRAHVERKSEFAPTLVRRGATIGANATIVCGRTIGEYALIGAGSLVSKDVPPYALVVGVPARQTGWVCACGEVLAKVGFVGAATCKRCSSRYSVAEESVTLSET